MWHQAGDDKDTERKGSHTVSEFTKRISVHFWTNHHSIGMSDVSEDWTEIQTQQVFFYKNKFVLQQSPMLDKYFHQWWSEKPSVTSKSVSGYSSPDDVDSWGGGGVGAEGLRGGEGVGERGATFCCSHVFLCLVQGQNPSQMAATSRSHLQNPVTHIITTNSWK